MAWPILIFASHDGIFGSLCANVLETRGYLVRLSNTPSRTLDLIDEELPDALVLDTRQRASFWDLTEQILSGQGRDRMKMVLLINPADTNRAVALGVNWYVPERMAAFETADYLIEHILPAEGSRRRRRRLPVNTSIPQYGDLQRYVSHELTHFVGRSLDSDLQRYKLFARILRSGLLTSNPKDPFNPARSVEVEPGHRFSDNDRFRVECVCFCDIPVHDLAIHTDKYSRFGLAFPKSFLVSKGANPVFYIAVNSVMQLVKADDGIPPVVRTPLDPGIVKQIVRYLAEPELRYEPVELANYFDEMVLEVFRSSEAVRKYLLDRHIKDGQEISTEYRRLEEILRLLHSCFFSYLKFFDDTRSEEDPDNYYMEREWRILGSVRFNMDDVQRVLLPRSFRARFEHDFPTFTGTITELE